MKKLTRIVVDSVSPSVLTFEEGVLGGKISFDYFDRKRISKRVPAGTKLINTKVAHNKFNSAVAYGQGAFFC